MSMMKPPHPPFCDASLIYFTKYAELHEDSSQNNILFIFFRVLPTMTGKYMSWVEI